MAVSTKKPLMWDDERFAKVKPITEAVTAVYAQSMLERSGIKNHPTESPLIVLDNACGNGVVTAVLQELLNNQASEGRDITCGDLADAMVESTKNRIQEQGWTNVHALKVDAQDTQLHSDHFTHIYTNFGVMLFPDPSKAVSECFRILRPGGVCAFTTWQRVGWLADVKAAFESIPDIPPCPAQWEMTRIFKTGSWDQPDFIGDFMAKHGFENVQVEAVPNITRAESVEDLKATLDLCIHVALSLFWTQEQREKFAKPDFDAKIKAWFREKYGDGPIEWHWIGLVTTASKPK